MNNLNNLELGERVFATLEEARAAVDSQLQDKGFVYTIKHTRRVGNKKDGDVKAVVLYCSCGAQILDHIATLPTANVLNPAVLRGRGRPVGSLGRPQSATATSTSTQRDPSQFEVVEASVRPQRRCGRCHQSGHNARRCRQPPAPPAPPAAPLTPPASL